MKQQSCVLGLIYVQTLIMSMLLNNENILNLGIYFIT